MTEPNHEPTPDILDRAAEALRTAPVAPLPDRLADAVSAEARRRERRRRVMRYIRYGSAATVAAGLLVAAGVLWVGDGSAAAQVRKAAENAAKAKSVRVVHNRGGKGAIEWTDYFQGEQFRTEVGHLIVVADGTTKRRLEVNTDTRTACVRDMTELELRELKRRQQNWLTEPLQPLIQNDKEYAVRELPSERQNGRLIKVYQIDHMIGGKTDFRITLWADATTELPIRARIERPKAKANPLAAETNPLSADELMNHNRPPTTIIEYEDWNKEFDAKLFSLEVPKGYRTSDHPLRDTEPPPERTQFILFRRAMDDAEKAKSFRAVVHMTMANAPAGTPKAIEQKLFGQGDKMRVEFGDTMVSVADATAKKMLILNTKAKTAQTMPLNGAPGDLQKGVTAAVKKVLDRKEGVEDLGEKFLGGRKTHVYRVKELSLGGMKADVTYWIDAKRDLPVRLEMKTAGPVTMTQSIDYLGFNEELDPKLFEMTVPKGYKVVDKPVPKKGDK
jgi:outer membrane lipoprotein-sorting protein